METPEMTATCQRCGARLTLPLPAAFVVDGDAKVRGVDLSDGDVWSMLKDLVERYPCPECEHVSLRVQET